MADARPKIINLPNLSNMATVQREHAFKHG